MTGKEIVAPTEFYGKRFANDELLLTNRFTYYVRVEVKDAINRTARARSNGVTVMIDPPPPAPVRDGPIAGEDRDYQTSTEQLWINWDSFGDPDMPGLRITHYEVAVGDNPAVSTTRSNVQSFINVGLTNNATITDLRLVSKSIKYYATVRGYAENGAYVDSTSDGVRVGYHPGMTAGETETKQYSNSSSTLSASWTDFTSDVAIMSYHWGISSAPFIETNITFMCDDLFQLAKEHFDIQALQKVWRNTYVKSTDLKLSHDKQYYITAIGEDRAGQCIAAEPVSVLVDLTPPKEGEIVISGIAGNAQYISDPEKLDLLFEEFEDPESGISAFYFQVRLE